MSGRRKSGAAFLEAMESAQEKGPAETPTAVTPGQGNWSRMAVRGMQGRIDELSEEVANALKAQCEGILQGRVPIPIPVDAIDDEIGSDRILSDPLSEAGEGDSFASLKANISERGLRVPLRVRPRDPDWQPDPATPWDVAGARFSIQSGRRRLAACRQLGIDPICFVTIARDPKVEDLQERYFENALRRNLGLVERLYSIGLIRQSMPDHSMRQISELLGVPLATLSRGTALVENWDALSARLDLTTATRDDIDAALKALRDAVDPAPEPPAQKHDARAEIRHTTPHGSLRVRQRSDGRTTFTLESRTLTADDAERLVHLLTEMSVSDSPG